MEWIAQLAEQSPVAIGRNLLTVALAIVFALVVHGIALWVLRRFVGRSDTRLDDVFVQKLRQPTRWIAVAMALTAARPSLVLTERGAAAWEQVSGLVLAGLVGWMALAALGFVREWVELRSDVTVADNLTARRRRTRIAILHRIGAVIIILLTICLMLMTIPAVRSVGITVLASAGLVGLAVGAAAQPALKNLIAGVQMAITEPIRIDDVVIVAGEWGRIEEIRLTYVVVKVWDERRVVVPVSTFLEEPFQNWTRQTSELLGTVVLYVDPRTDVARMRAKFEELVAADPLWDGRVVGVQVIDTAPDHIQVRGLVSAADAGASWELRCNVREAMLAFLSAEMPESLARHRLVAGEAPQGEEAPSAPPPPPV